MSAVRLQQVTKRFGDSPVVADISLDVADGEFVALLGPSGSGKTTLLRMIAGFETPDAGRIFLDGEDVTNAAPLQRRCGMVFQHYALFPHMSVATNIGYGLANQRMTRADRDARVEEMLALVDLAGFGSRPVTELSGGQQQRVALARALAPRPRVLLLDEPLSNLDPSLRERTRTELRALVARIRITTILVTHEQEEAFDLADRIALLYRGRLEQVGAPDLLYHEPASPFVTGFVGRASTIRSRAANTNGESTVELGGVTVPLASAARLSGDITLQLRPEALRFSGDGAIAGQVVRRRYAGATAYFTIGLNDGQQVEVAAALDAARVGDAVRLTPTGSGIYAWPAVRP